MDVSENSDTPKSSILIGFSIIKGSLDVKLPSYEVLKMLWIQ